MSIFDKFKDLLEKYFGSKNKKSKIWKIYKTSIFSRHCEICQDRESKIYEAGVNEPYLPEHQFCKCNLDWLDAINCGEASKLGISGADFYLKYYKKLLDYYITKNEAKKLGWKSNKGNLAEVAPGKMIGGDIFLNVRDILPGKVGRIWYECDLDYESGFRKGDRLVYSNDGLIFKTDNHYSNFIAVE